MLLQALAAVRQRLEASNHGQVDTETIQWFLRDRKFNVDDTVSKLEKMLQWRSEFRRAQHIAMPVAASRPSSAYVQHDHDRKHPIRSQQVLLIPSWTNRADEITETSVAAEAATGKAYLHSSTDVHGRPVIVIRVNKHITSALRCCPRESRLPSHCYNPELDSHR